MLTPDQVAEHEHSVELSVPIGRVGSCGTRSRSPALPMCRHPGPADGSHHHLSAPVAAPGLLPVTADPITRARPRSRRRSRLASPCGP